MHRTAATTHFIADHQAHTGQPGDDDAAGGDVGVGDDDDVCL